MTQIFEGLAVIIFHLKEIIKCSIEITEYLHLQILLSADDICHIFPVDQIIRMIQPYRIDSIVSSGDGLLMVPSISVLVSECPSSICTRIGSMAECIRGNCHLVIHQLCIRCKFQNVGLIAVIAVCNCISCLLQLSGILLQAHCLHHPPSRRSRIPVFLQIGEPPVPPDQRIRICSSTLVIM